MPEATESSPAPQLRRPPGAQVEHRPRRKVDWELIWCGLHGHELVGVGAEHIRAQDGLLVREADGLRWHRCLRCDGWVAIGPPEAPSEPHPPDRAEIVIPLRGKALRDRVVLRLIACDRVLHFVILVGLGIAVLLFAGREQVLKGEYLRILTALQGGVAGGPAQTSGHVGFLHELDRLFSLRQGKLHEFGFAMLAYGLLEGVEAVGLWLTKRWAEYLTFIATAVLLPLEVSEILNQATPLKVIGFLINLAVVVYLLLAKRLFGLRGGGAVDERERARDTSWEAVEQATPGSLPAAAP